MSLKNNNKICILTYTGLAVKYVALGAWDGFALIDKDQKVKPLNDLSPITHNRNTHNNVLVTDIIRKES